MSKKTKRKATDGPAKAGTPCVEITELSQLEKISHGAPLVVELEINRAGEKPTRMKLSGRRLRPGETKEIKLLLERALPPLLPPEKAGGEPRYDMRDPVYLKTAEEYRRAARALAIYTAFPVFRQGLEAIAGKEPIDQERIVKFIEERELEDDVLEALFMRLTERVVGLGPHLGFT